MNIKLNIFRFIISVAAFVSLLCFSGFARAHPVQCRMNFTLKSWSFFYKSGRGTGDIVCSNSQTARVSLRAQGGGFTIGKSKIIDGLGVFSDVSSIDELFGNYANAEAHAGAGDSASARVLTKGEVSLTLTGTGKGVDLGVNVGNFKISKR